MANSILAVGSTAGESATFTLTEDTLVWLHQGKGGAVVELYIKGSDGLFSAITTMEDARGKQSGVLPKGDYKVVRISGTCGFQSA